MSDIKTWQAWEVMDALQLDKVLANKLFVGYRDFEVAIKERDEARAIILSDSTKIVQLEQIDLPYWKEKCAKFQELFGSAVTGQEVLRARSQKLVEALEKVYKIWDNIEVPKPYSIGDITHKALEEYAKGEE